ncbi:uncharacterized protein YueI [Enterococcus sp. PF1-24]|uniref:YueI family protein n=1 Tax=unclassified Enterococcus TaxID=2608891 RepID=UPI00247622E7|nr:MULTISPECIES: YueI family protein [unclassified Enterococcus]MDH6363830.1 uncharacterized protein YueI [Enterococcus sp. PFB1-1]MDH6400984.1 uncharacterized protein YueI [Enterococcus sp. PF1-24]
MGKDKIQQRINDSQFGRKLNPDEQHCYLGTFRERCYLTLMVRQMASDHNQQALIKEFQQHPDSKLLLNGKISEDLQTTYLQLATKNQLPFTIVNDFAGDNPDDFGGILIATTAVSAAIIDVEEKYPLSKPTISANIPEKKSKKGFWRKLFN